MNKNKFVITGISILIVIVLFAEVKNIISIINPRKPEPTISHVVISELEKYFGYSQEWFINNYGEYYAILLTKVNINDKVIIDEEVFIVILKNNKVYFTSQEGSLFTPYDLFAFSKFGNNSYHIERYNDIEKKWEIIN